LSCPEIKLESKTDKSGGQKDKTKVKEEKAEKGKEKKEKMKTTGAFVND
jgi:hypothetical protein